MHIFCFSQKNSLCFVKDGQFIYDLGREKILKQQPSSPSAPLPCFNSILPLIFSCWYQLLLLHSENFCEDYLWKYCCFPEWRLLIKFFSSTKGTFVCFLLTVNYAKTLPNCTEVHLVSYLSFLVLIFFIFTCWSASGRVFKSVVAK